MRASLFMRPSHRRPGPAGHPAIRLRPIARIGGLLAILLVAGCERYETPRSTAVDEALSGTSFAVPPKAQEPTLPVREGATTPAQRARKEIYLGTSPAAGAPPSGPDRGGEGVQVNFDGAEIREVVKVILGDILGETYAIDPAITGTVVLSSSGPLSEAQLLGALEATLQMHGAAMTRTAGGAYAITLADLARGSSSLVTLDGAAAPLAVTGTGVTVVPLRYMGAEAAAQFVQPLLSRPDQIRIDDTRNLILFAGSAAERQTVIDTLADIDVNWMAGRSVGIFPLNNASPTSVVDELEALVTPLSGAGRQSETVRFLPMARLNAVLAITSTPDQMRNVEQWVVRLDRGNTVGMQFFVYQLQHVPADDMAEILTASFGGITETDEDRPVDTVFSDAVDPVSVEVDVDAPPGFNPLATPPAPGTAAPPRQTSGRELAGVKIVPNTLNNTLLVRGTPQAYEMIEATIRRLDTAPLQVLIEATIAEVTLNDQLRYGVQYFLNTGSVKAGFNTSTPTAGGVIDPSLLNPLARLPGFNFVLTPGSSNITIDALSRITDVKVLSSPSLVVQDNSEAVLNVGDEVPIVTRSATNVVDTDAVVVNNIEYRDTGVILEVKPRISSNDIVALEIAQEVSRVATESVTSDTLTPTISQRKITSRINIQSGQTVVLGGLIQDSETRAKNKVPVLGDVPILGNLFSSTDNSAQRTELIVFLTPRIIHNAEDARDLSEELRSRMRSVRPIPVEPAPVVVPLERMPRPLETPSNVPDVTPVPAPAPSALRQRNGSTPNAPAGDATPGNAPPRNTTAADPATPPPGGDAAGTTGAVTPTSSEEPPSRELHGLEVGKRVPIPHTPIAFTGEGVPRPPIERPIPAHALVPKARPGSTWRML
ncbi:MAG: type II secretion system secretin GspD [Geminicoccaceae bacterium]|nr:type II secretion system secretin GspD [Geminicoccaceae bacterium]